MGEFEILVSDFGSCCTSILLEESNIGRCYGIIAVYLLLWIYRQRQSLYLWNMYFSLRSF